MSEQNQPINICDDIEVVGPGQMLREARKAKGLSQKDVALHLNFRLALVNELETESFDPDTPATFLRGYLRNYAKFLGLNENDVLESYQTLGVARQQRAEMKSFSQKEAKKAENKLLMVTSSVLAALMLGISAYHFIQEDKQDVSEIVTSDELPVTAEQDDVTAGNAQSSVPETSFEAEQETLSKAPGNMAETGADTQDSLVDDEQPVTSEPLTAAMMVVESRETVPQQTQPIAEEDEPDQQSQATEETLTTQIPAQDSGEPANSDAAIAQLKFVFKGDCWVNIFDADGNRLAWGIKKNDYVMTLNGKPPFNVTLGKPELVEMTYQGEQISLSQYKVGQIAKMIVPEPVIEEAAE
ncbi:RodZ domain-containing protein [Thalassotalea mangrovi]|uniref:DUF4115 domain-containing protein n=1 Tax=Thalassotalea mangrovi TaxID=2572245 RepID=A0A4U1B8S4_9GAMM|nr:RodZ domain-containing protein [Thalassotalea mangrovi]TKB47090.1 DUF4115 domain-containing protein [Thalassotalea mangrovi]